jgi:Fe-S cluster assembly iron-binding protein IscA
MKQIAGYNKILVCIFFTSVSIGGCSEQEYPNGNFSLQFKPLAQILPPQKLTSDETTQSNSNSSEKSKISNQSIMRTYKNNHFGGGVGIATVQKISNETYDISLQVDGGMTGAGQVFGTASVNGPANKLRLVNDKDGTKCILDFVVSQTRLVVNEVSCQALHGASIDFSGTLYRSGPRD